MFDTTIQAVSTILAALIGALFTAMIFRNGKHSEAAREQLDKVYAPAFQLVEAVLYKKIARAECDKIVLQLREIALSGGVLTDPAFVDLIEQYTRAPGGDLQNYPQFKYKFFDPIHCYLTIWYRLLDHIDRSYDLLCKKSFLPIRRIDYRLNRGQYINGVVYVLNLLRVEWPNLLFFAALFTALILSKQT